MKAFAEFTRTTLIGGVLIVLPIYVSILLLAKSLTIAVTLLSPVTAQIPATMQFRHLIASMILIAVCFVAGIIVRTGPGLRAQLAVERSLLRRIPGYVLVRGLAARMAGRQTDDLFAVAVAGKSIQLLDCSDVLFEARRLKFGIALAQVVAREAARF